MVVPGTAPSARVPPQPGTFIHVPTPGDHYSPATGSATMTVIYELARCHARHGGQTQIMVGHGTRHDYDEGQCLEVSYERPVNKKQRLIDTAAARLGLMRPFESSVYSVASAAIPPDFRGPIFLHNAPGALPLFKQRHPGSQICLYAHNVLFRTYGARELAMTIGAADRIICVSQFLADDLCARLGAPCDKLKVVLNGVDTQRFRPAPMAPLDATPLDAEPVILFVGRVVPEKGADLLLRAARKIAGGKRRFKVRIVGSRGFTSKDPLSPYEIELRKLAEPLGAAVEFQPFVDRDQVLLEYQRAAIFCAPSNWDEPLGMTVLEGMACGLPTIASRRGGIPEVGGDAIQYFQPPNVDELADRLNDLLGDRRGCVTWGALARQRATTLSWELQYDRLIDVIAAD